MPRKLTDPVHGTRYTYVTGCGCAECCEANTRWQAGWRAARLAAGNLRLVNGYWVKRGVDAGRTASGGIGADRGVSSNENGCEGHDGADEREEHLGHA